MKQSPLTQDDQLWRAVVEKLDVGVLVFDQRGVLVYTNDEAARLLDYRPHDLLGLDREDFVALCRRDRLDGNRFATVFLADPPGDVPHKTFEVVTSNRRLGVRALALDVGRRSVVVLLLRELTHWRAELIAQTVMAEMHKPLSFASNSCLTLMTRMASGGAHPFELQDLARIIHESVDRALTLWETMVRLYSTDPYTAPELRVGPVVLPEALRAALRELEQQVPQKPPSVVMDLPDGLPDVRASASHLHAALCALVEGAAARMAPQDRLLISASDRQSYVQLDLTLDSPSSTVHGYLFDGLPFAIAEQVIVQHGGRVWIEAQRGQPITISCSLPVWSADDD